MEESKLKKLFYKQYLKIITPFLWIYQWLKRTALYVNFKTDFKKFKRQAASKKQRFIILWKDRYPCLNDRTALTHFSWHYVYHTAWAARTLAQTLPAKHVDISSSLYFSALVSAFVPMEFYDFRPASLHLENLTTGYADLFSLPFEDNSISSLSCMHVVEHVGLGRYGDPLDPDGDLKAMNELTRVLALNGLLLFVVPVGQPRICFNAHRIYSYEQVIEAFKKLHLEDFLLIPDDPKDAGLMVKATAEFVDRQKYGCGCFLFRKIA